MTPSDKLYDIIQTQKKQVSYFIDRIIEVKHKESLKGKDIIHMKQMVDNVRRINETIQINQAELDKMAF